MSFVPQTLERDGIAQRIPHRGSMCLLERLEGWDAETIRCSTTTHRQADNPLRTASGLLAPNAIEYAAQAMALHGGLLASEGATASAGFLASTRGVRTTVARLDEIEGRLQVEARLRDEASRSAQSFKSELARAQRRLIPCRPLIQGHGRPP